MQPIATIKKGYGLLTMASLFAVSGLAFLGTEKVSAQTITVYIGAPGAEISPHGEVVTETFNTWAQADPQTGNVTSTALSDYGAEYHFYTGTGSILPADEYGGAQAALATTLRWVITGPATTIPTASP